MNIETKIYLDGRKTERIVENNSMGEEVVRIHALFFKKSYSKQRDTLRLLIWWAVKRYIKILFKK